MNATELAHALLRRLNLPESKRLSELERVTDWVQAGLNDKNVPGVKFDPRWQKIAEEAWSWGQLAAKGIDPTTMHQPERQVAPPPADARVAGYQRLHHHHQASQGRVR